MKTRQVLTCAVVLAVLVAGLTGVAKAQPPAKCPNVQKGQGVGSSKGQCPGDFEPVYLVLTKCKSWFSSGSLQVIPDDVELNLKTGPYRVAWIVIGRQGGKYDWTIERKGGGGTDILPGAKKIDQAAADAYFSGDPENAKGGDSWIYRVVVTKKSNGKVCAEVDPQIRIKDDPPPPPPPPTSAGRESSLDRRSDLRRDAAASTGTNLA